MDQTFSAPPAHSADLPYGIQKLQKSIPTMTSHTCQQLGLAHIVYRAHMPSRLSDVDAYARSLQMHSQIEEYLKRGPSWMQIGSTETGTDWAPWVHWQRTVFQISAAHKVILIHRPVLGSAFRGDQRFASSLQASLRNARFILNTFLASDSEYLRKTWSVLAHTTAACLVIILEAAYATDATREVEIIKPIYEVVDAFNRLSPSTRIAGHGFAILNTLLQARQTGFGSDRSTGSSNHGEVSEAGKHLLTSWWQRRSSVHRDDDSSMLGSDLFGDLGGVNPSQLNQIDLFEWVDFTQHDLTRFDQFLPDLSTFDGSIGPNNDMHIQ